MEYVYDMIVIGGGPAGYTAALYACRGGLSVLVIEKMSAGGQMAVTGIIDNYPGFEEGIDGFTLGMRMQAGAERFGAKTLHGTVTEVALREEIKRVSTADGTYWGKTVVIATGAEPKLLGLDREEELSARGVHYCAHCDGRFYKGKTVVVVGGGNTAASDALYLSRLAEKVILVHRRDTLRAAKIYRDSLMAAENVVLRWNCEVAELYGKERLTGIGLKDVKTGHTLDLPCDGVFVSIGRTPATALFQGQVHLDPSGYILSDESTQTNLEGVYAAGDVRTKTLRQVVTAVADGAVAASRAENDLSL